jgi:hypothetical protein
VSGLIGGVPYPCWIFATRYQGVYEGGAWAATNCDPTAIPADAEGSDVECAEWWGAVRAAGGTFALGGGRVSFIAVGDTPGQALVALTDLIRKAQEG